MPLGLAWLAATAPAASPAEWREADIRASHRVLHPPGTLPDAPRFAADPLNLFVLIEDDGRLVSILDGERFERIHRFRADHALHAEPQFTPDGRYLFLVSRDGWVSKFDLWNLQLIAVTRAGIRTNNIALAGDGSYLAVANDQPHTLVILDGALNPVQVHAARDQAGRRSSAVAAVHTAGPRRSFVATLTDVPEVWELSYDPAAAPIPAGVIHDFRYREGTFLPGFLNPRRSFPERPPADFIIAPDATAILAASRDGGGEVVHLDARRGIAHLDLPGLPRPGAGSAWHWQGRDVVAIPNGKLALVSIVEARDWKTIREVQTAGPGAFISSHATARHAWVNAGRRGDRLQLIDRQTLTITATIEPAPGKVLAHLGFTRDGRYALATVADANGAVIVIDTVTLAEITRLPARHPAGIFNVGNRIAPAETTP